MIPASENLVGRMLCGLLVVKRTAPDKNGRSRYDVRCPDCRSEFSVPGRKLRKAQAECVCVYGARSK